MRVWVDFTNSPARAGAAAGDRAAARRAGTRSRSPRATSRRRSRCATASGSSTPRSAATAARRCSTRPCGLASPLAASLCAGRGATARFELAIGHGSNDITVAAALLRIPCSTTFDYEWATVQHNVNCRLAQAVVVPEAIPPERLYRYGARRKLRRYPGLKEEYYLADFEPDPAVLGRARAGPGAADRRRAHPAGGLALSPLRERPVRPGARPAARRPDRGAAAHRPSSAPSWTAPVASSSPSGRSTRSRSSPTPTSWCRRGAR